MAPDLEDEAQSFKEMEEEIVEKWEPLFDPVAFNEKNKPLTLDKYRLETEAL